MITQRIGFGLMASIKLHLHAFFETGARLILRFLQTLAYCEGAILLSINSHLIRCAVGIAVDV